MYHFVTRAFTRTSFVTRMTKSDKKLVGTKRTQKNSQTTSKPYKFCAKSQRLSCLAAMN